MPVTLRETGVRLGEAVAGQPSRRHVTIISKGWGSSGYYSRDLLERDGPRIFGPGTQMYLNHPSRTEEVDRPERDVRDLAATLATTPRMQGNDLVAEADILPHQRELIDSIAPHIGLSIRAAGETELGEAEGREGPIVKSLDEGISVDFVTKAGRGGSVGALIESAREAELTEAECEALYTGLLERAVSKDERVALAKKGQAIPVKDDSGNVVDGRFPMASCADVSNAAQAIGRAKGDVSQVKALIKRVASKLSCPVPFASTEAARLAEARNVGHYFESRIHKAFTEAADDHFGQGHLSRPERIAMSGAIGDALDAFSESLTKNAPQLYQRDLYAGPDAAGSNVTEAAAGGPTQEADMADEKTLAALQESVSKIETRLTETESKLSEAEKARDAEKQRADLAEGRLADIQAERIVRDATIDVEGRKDPVSVFEGMRPSAVQRAVDSVLAETLPRDADGKLDREKLIERARKAAKAERDYLAEHGGNPVRDLGASRTDTGDVTDEQLAEAFQRVGGMSEAAVKYAVNGR